MKTRDAKGESSAEEVGRALTRQVTAGFTGTMEPASVSLAYRAMLLAGVIGLALVPLTYIATVAGIGWLLVWQATRLPIGFGLRFRIPLTIALAVAFLFMLRALLFLFARRRHVVSSPRFPIHTYPALAVLIHEIGKRTGTPVPAQVAFFCEPNAAASYGDSLWQQFFSRELVLHIGLPLIGGRNVEQLAGVIAHELGHFSQRGATRLTAMHRWILDWIEAASAEPEGFSQDTVTDSQGSITHWLHLAITFGINSARALLNSIYGITCLVCAGILRQMEYDADRRWLAIVGMRTLSQDMTWIHEIQRGFREAMKSAGECLPRGCLPDDLPDLALAWLQQWNEEQRAAMHERLARETTGWLDTHPAPKDRIEAARRNGAKRIFHCDLPARVLVPNYAGLCRAVSREFYYNLLGSAPDNIVFAPSAELFPYWEVYASRTGEPK